MKKIRFHYGDEECVVLMQRLFVDLIKAHIFIFREDRKWYQLRWKYITSKSFFLGNMKSKQDILNKLESAVTIAIEDNIKQTLADSLRRSL